MTSDALSDRDEHGPGSVDHPLTPTDDQRLSDMVHFPARPGDLRVVHGDWVFYIVAVPRGRGFLGSSGGGGSGSGSLSSLDLDGDSVVVGLALFLLLAPAAWLVGRFGGASTDRGELARARAIKVGVIRVPNPRGWTVDRHRIVHRVQLTKGKDPRPTMLALAARAEEGEFDTRT